MSLYNKRYKSIRLRKKQSKKKMKRYRKKKKFFYDKFKKNIILSDEILSIIELIRENKFSYDDIRSSSIEIRE